MFCNRCGTQNPDGSANCFNCGRSMDAPADTRVVAPVVPGARQVPAAALLARIDVAGTPLVVTDMVDRRTVNHLGRVCERTVRKILYD
jgi:hypothetical protein